MEINFKVLSLIVVTSAVIGGYIEHSVQRKSTDTTTVQDNVVTVVKEIQKPDGTKETDTTITDRSKKQEQVVIAVPAPNWFVAAGAGLNTGLQPVYMASVNKRLIGPIFIGVWGTTQQSAGVQLAIQF